MAVANVFEVALKDRVGTLRFRFVFETYYSDLPPKKMRKKTKKKQEEKGKKQIRYKKKKKTQPPGTSAWAFLGLFFSINHLGFAREAGPQTNTTNIKKN